MTLLRSCAAGLLASILVGPPTLAEAFRLDRIPIVRFSPMPDHRLLVQPGVLHLDGIVTWRGEHTIGRPAGTPEWALNRNLIKVQSWLAFRSLGGEATANFELGAGEVNIPLGDQLYFAVGLAPSARDSNGHLVNLSTRARLAGYGDVIIAGFVIADRPRPVLVRAVGPTLTRFGVTEAHPDPRLSIKRNDGLPDISNDDWSNQGNAAMIEKAAARAGAFPLDPASLDAAKLAILPPGAYTVHVSTGRIDVRNREVLVEVYRVPEDIFD